MSNTFNQFVSIRTPTPTLSSLNASNHTEPSRFPLEIEPFYQMFLSILILSLFFIGAFYFLFSFFSFRVFRCGIRTMFIPLIAFLIGVLYSALQVMFYALCISGIYVSVNRNMTIYELFGYVVIVTLPLLWFGSGFFARIQVDYF
jgi:hypothetical protein